VFKVIYIVLQAFIGVSTAFTECLNVVVECLG